jgi:hypothetical protein
MSVGVARQHAGITGQVENCQTVVFAAYVTARAHTLFDFRSRRPAGVPAIIRVGNQIADSARVASVPSALAGRRDGSL